MISANTLGRSFGAWMLPSGIMVSVGYDELDQIDQARALFRPSSHD
jgi:hypothetical protein